MSERVLGGLLRGELGFEGAIVTDALDMAGIGGVDAIPTTAVRALAAGADLCCLGPAPGVEVVDATLDAIEAAVTGGSLPEERLGDAVARVETIGSKLGRHDASTPRLETIGAVAASRALRIDGRIAAPIRGAHVVELEVSPTIAAGAVPWGVAAPLVALDPTTSR